MSENAETRDHSRQLITTIRDVTAGAIAGIEAIVVITGPGSYAGLRVGIATAEGLALARDVPVYGIGTLEAVAAVSPVEGDWTLIHPIGRGEFAVQDLRSGVRDSEVGIASAPDLAGRRLKGEGAGRLGGVEATARDRVLAALRLHAAAIASGTATPGATAFYIREPHITRPRRAPVERNAS